MAIFSKVKPENETRPAQPRGPAAPSGALSIIGAGMTVRGDLEANGVVKVEGSVEGNVKAAAQVLVAKGGVVQGDVETTEAVVGGTVSGAIRARDRVEVQSGASVHGDITTRRISVAEGGILNGVIRMEETPAARGAQAAESKEQARVQSQTQVPLQRPSVPMARIAVPPRATGQPS